MTTGEIVRWCRESPERERREVLAISALQTLEAIAQGTDIIEGYEALDCVSLEVALIRWRHAIERATFPVRSRTY